MDTAKTLYKVHQCSKCPGDTEYFCECSPRNLCRQCKEDHIKDLKTIDHIVLIYREKFKYNVTRGICVRHPNNVYSKYCKPCQVPVCDSCLENNSHIFRSFLHGQKRHKIQEIQGAYQKKRQQHHETIHTIRTEALFYRTVLMTAIKADFKTCHTEFSFYQTEMLKKAQTLKHLIDYVLNDLFDNVFCDFDFKHRCLKQQMKMKIHTASLQRYEYIYEQSAFSPLQFLSIKISALQKKHLALHTSQLFMSESLNKEDVMKSLTEIQITEQGHRHVRNECLLKLMSCPEFHQHLSVKGNDRCYHISFATSNQIWVSDNRNYLTLTNTTGDTLHQLQDLCIDLYGGVHTVSSACELFYIDRINNINKLSTDMKTTTQFLATEESTLRPLCVYWSRSAGDLLVGMQNCRTRASNVTRYNQYGQQTQTIQHGNSGEELYSKPNYITENNNGDVVVSDYDAVVVTERGGRHRFSYKGHPSTSGLEPLGICTDALSHILVCDNRQKTVQILNEIGQFLSHLLIRPLGIFRPYSLSYDIHTYRLWVGSGSYMNNTLCVYRYLYRKCNLTDLNSDTADVMDSLKKITNHKSKKKKHSKKNKCQLKLSSPPELLQSLTVGGIDGCYHISCVNSDRFWASDNKSNLFLTNTKGVILLNLKGICVVDGAHTVNNEGELIYIDMNYTINKRSKKNTIPLPIEETIGGDHSVFTGPRPLEIYLWECITIGQLEAM